MTFELTRLILTSLLLWVSSFLIHELCHVLEGFRQGSKMGKIYIERYSFFPTLYATSDGIKNGKLFFLSGGLYSGLILLGISIFFAWSLDDIVLFYPLLLFGFMNLAYSPFECLFISSLDKLSYKIGRYFIYLLVFVGVTWLLLGRIMEYIT